MAATLITVFGDPAILAIAVVLDLVIGDPSYPAHPVRLIGRTISLVENTLRGIGMDGYVGGVLLFVVVAFTWGGGLTVLVMMAATISPWIAWVLHVFLLYSMLALGDLLRHVWSVERALVRADVDAARRAISLLVGRDTEPMDAAACRRAAIESLSENLTDGFTSPLFWYVLAGLPGLVIFKIASTMDSMVGYKTPQYLRFGWFGARLDDMMNYVPARLTWLLVVCVAFVLPRCSGRKAFVTGFVQHAVLPGPNAGWSEAAAAGAIERRLVGPIWLSGRLVTETWLGHVDDPPAQSHDDVVRAMTLVTTTGGVATALSCAVLAIAR